MTICLTPEQATHLRNLLGQTRINDCPENAVLFLLRLHKMLQASTDDLIDLRPHHLAMTSGKPLCGDAGPLNTDVNFVTCYACLELHGE